VSGRIHGRWRAWASQTSVLREISGSGFLKFASRQVRLHVAGSPFRAPCWPRFRGDPGRIRHAARLLRAHRASPTCKGGCGWPGDDRRSRQIAIGGHIGLAARTRLHDQRLAAHIRAPSRSMPPEAGPRRAHRPKRLPVRRCAGLAVRRGPEYRRCGRSGADDRWLGQLNFRPRKNECSVAAVGSTTPRMRRATNGRFRNLVCDRHIECAPPGPLVFGFKFVDSRRAYQAGDFTVNH